MNAPARTAWSFHSPLLRLLAAALLLLGMAAAQAEAEGPRRVALVIGNNAYATAPLNNPVNDARAMARALQSTGFSVMLKTDTTQPELLALLREFGNRLRDGGAGTVGLFYFAGHGMQIKGRNFLIPVGANIEHEDEVAYQALDAQAVMDKMEAAGNGTNIVILDACRNNPFARSFRSGRQGLAQMDAPVGTLVAFSTAPGSVASDGPQGTNGLYTAHLLNAIGQPGQKVEDVFKQVRNGVLRDSNRRQVPWEASSLVGDFYFVAPRPTLALAPPPAPPGGVVAPAPAFDTQAALDDALWAAVRESSSSAELFAYLNRFPNGLHAREARSRLTDLVAPGPGAAARPAATLNPAQAENALQESESGERDRLANIAAAQARIDEIVRWGDVGTDRRPAQPKKNAAGFAEGDRYRFRIQDLRTQRYGADYLWRIDRIETDGSLWVNDGSQRFDARGQLRGGTDEDSGQWIDWQPPLPLAEALAAPEGQKLAVASIRRARDAAGGITEATLTGALHVGPRVALSTPAGNFQTRRLDAYLQGPVLEPDGSRHALTLKLSWWFTEGVGLAVQHDSEIRRDDRLVRHLRHEATALDVLNAAPRLAEARP